MVVRLPARAPAGETSLSEPGYDNLLIISPGELNFFGEGRLVVGLNEAFPGGWFGGTLPERGFWGSNSAEDAIVCDWLVRQLSRPADWRAPR